MSINNMQSNNIIYNKEMNYIAPQQFKTTI